MRQVRVRQVRVRQVRVRDVRQVEVDPLVVQMGDVLGVHGRGEGVVV